MSYNITEMTANDYEDSYALWQRCAGIGLSDADSPCAIKKFLEHNPGLSFIARQDDGRLVGAVLCGSDTRRGYLYHLAVDGNVRRQGIGRALVEKAFEALKKMDIHKCHIMVYRTNEMGLAFWRQEGWKIRSEIVLMSYDLHESAKDSSC